MKMRFAAIIFFIAFLLQGTVLNLFSIHGATPNLILCLVVIFSFLYEDFNGLILGVVFGLLMDLCMAQYVGVAAFSYLIVSLIAINMRENINKENIASIIIVSVGSTLIYNFLYFIISAGFGSIYSLTYWLKLQPIYILYNSAIVFILYLIFIKRVVKYRNDRYLIWKKR
ncbi:rod shape-determining protein MreD [Aminipila luticellarii]|mgnify:CR=1 FL=1|uniref:Rod shape-determining protein MreD n=1 Tax=Aminipila luticellarii TaxID=2507160 RepID=A0A410PVU3_9FIRM|nr:rod shape-determining protein MreD [Aminipila luticellarii]QAT43059.1 rod shape-determining protein MreD [Aminipila luticellarii]